MSRYSLALIVDCAFRCLGDVFRQERQNGGWKKDDSEGLFKGKSQRRHGYA